MYHALHFPMCTFTKYPFLLYQLHLKAKIVNQVIILCVRKRLTINQSNVQTATAENKGQYTLNTH